MRKSKQGRTSEEQDAGFQDRLMRLIEWVADRDPVAAARLIGEYTDDLMRELGGAEPQASKS